MANRSDHANAKEEEMEHLDQVTSLDGSDTEFLLGLFEEGLVPANTSADAAVPDAYIEEEIVY